MANSNRSPFPPPVVLESLSDHTHTIIFLHGRGSSAKEFCEDLGLGSADEVYYLRRELPHWRWILPCAPQRWSTPLAMQLREWFDVQSLTDPGARPELQIDGLRETIAALARLVAAEAKRLPGPRRVVLAGISQGAAAAVLALLHGLCCPAAGLGDHLAGFIGYCTWMPLGDAFAETVDSTDHESLEPDKLSFAVRSWFEATLGTGCCGKLGTSSTGRARGFAGCPVLLGHNKDDGVIDFALGEALSEVLKRVGLDVHWLPREDGGHWINPETGDEQIVAFLQSIEAASATA